ncbi:MAG: 30S ribosomal protein S15 [Flavobacteriales bacterium]|nr:30S ribosomal protein S15 [Flavobacteriales bacterium]
MHLDIEVKKEFFKKFGNSDKDSGNAEAQIAMFTHKIEHLTKHLKSNKKDFFTQRSLVNMVGRRRKLLNYLTSKDIERYRAIVKTLGLRK